MGAWDFIDTNGVHHEGAPDNEGDLSHVDMMRVFMVYPNGDSDTRWFAGPWDSWADLWDDVAEWYDNDGKS